MVLTNLITEAVMRGIEVLFALAGFMATAFGVARGIEFLFYGPVEPGRPSDNTTTVNANSRKQSAHL
jgi:hypothetical protein